MSTSDPGTASRGPTQPASPDTGSASARPSQQAGIEASPEVTKDIRQSGPDTGLRASSFATKLFRTASLSQARRIVCDDVTHLINLPTDHLWKSYLVEDEVLTKVKLHLIASHWLTELEKWNCDKVDKDQFLARGTGGSEAKTFLFFSVIFNLVLDCLKKLGRQTFIETMVHAGFVGLRSTRIGTHRPDAFLRTATSTSPTPGESRWSDSTCPFEYKFGNGDATDNDTKALWSLVHIMRCDPRRMFSFGSTVCGTKFHIWLLCRAAPFTFTPFDWFENPEPLLKFLILLATASETDLGFDTNIKKIGETDFDLQFTIGEKVYHTSELLYDIGADAPTGRGSRAFEVVDQETEKVRVIKDCWVEDRPGKQMEHVILAEIERDVGNKDFGKYFIDVAGHRRTNTSGGFGRVCEILQTRTFKPADRYEPHILIPATDVPKPTYTAAASVADQDHYLRPSPTKPPPERPPHPRFRYQVVYDEKGIPLFEETSFVEVFCHIGRATYGLYLLHQAGWVHRDFSPGNVIVVEGKAKISDLEFAKRRVASQLEELTRPTDRSLAGPREIRTGTPYFTAVEAEEGGYLFLPQPKLDLRIDDSPGAGDELDWDEQLLQEGGDQMTKSSGGTTGSVINLKPRIWLHNPLHDYESAWWVAVWFVFHCKPEGVSDTVMEEARGMVYQNRTSTFAVGRIKQACELLPAVLQPLGEVLVEMRNILANAYRSFEETFDGSKMSAVFKGLRPCLKRLAELARGLTVTLTVLRGKLKTVEAVFHTAAPTEEECQEVHQVMEREGGAGGEPVEVDNPFLVRETGDVVSRKRGRGGSPLQVDRALTRRRFDDEQTVELWISDPCS